jgi:hypothetical protein
MTETTLSLVQVVKVICGADGRLVMLRSRILSHSTIVPRIRRSAGSRFLCRKEKKIMKILILCMISLCAGVAGAQWNTRVTLTADSFNYYNSRMVVDNNLDLHVFSARDMLPRINGQRCLTYLRFNRNGIPLSAPFVLFSDSQNIDVSPALLLDHDSNIRVLWTRYYYPNPTLGIMIYMKFAPDGSILEGPNYLYERRDQDVPITDNQMIQCADGTIWYVDAVGCAHFDEAMNFLQPYQLLSPQPDQFSFEKTQVAYSPQYGVWTCSRILFSLGQFIAIMRLDTVQRELIRLSLADTTFGEQVNTESFFIDSAGAFHSILYRSARGTYYLRSNQTGMPLDSVVLDPRPDALGETNLIQIGRDTLMWLCDKGTDYGRLIRYSINPAGHLWAPPFEIRPLLIIPTRDHIWRNGSHWLLGDYADLNTHLIQLGLIHVHGAEESLSGRLSTEALTSETIYIHPQPVQSSLVLELPNSITGTMDLCVFNLLGQTVYLERQLQPVSGRLRISIPVTVSSGIYFVVLNNRHRSLSAKFVLQH